MFEIKLEVVVINVMRNNILAYSTPRSFIIGVEAPRLKTCTKKSTTKYSSEQTFVA